MWTTPHDESCRIPCWNVGVARIAYIIMPNSEHSTIFTNLFWKFQSCNYSKCRNTTLAGLETHVFDEGLLQVPSANWCEMQIYSIPGQRSILAFSPILAGGACLSQTCVTKYKWNNHLQFIVVYKECISLLWHAQPHGGSGRNTRESPEGRIQLWGLSFGIFLTSDTKIWWTRLRRCQGCLHLSSYIGMG